MSLVQADAAVSGALALSAGRGCHGTVISPGRRVTGSRTASRYQHRRLEPGPAGAIAGRAPCGAWAAEGGRDGPAAWPHQPAQGQESP